MNIARDVTLTSETSGWVERFYLVATPDTAFVGRRGVSAWVTLDRVERRSLSAHFEFPSLKAINVGDEITWLMTASESVARDRTQLSEYLDLRNERTTEVEAYRRGAKAVPDRTDEDE